MKIYEAPRGTPEFFSTLSKKKEEFKDWSYLHVILKEECKEFDLKMIIKYIELHVNAPEAFVIFFPDTKQIILLAEHKYNADLTKINRKLYEKLTVDQVNSRISSLNPNMLSEFHGIAKDNLQPKDIPAQISLKRALRLSNHIMVFDDDIMVLKQIEKIVQDMGEVTILQSATTFLDEYVRNAPDILFLDIHLAKLKGTELAKNLVGTIDPFAHIIMISSDTLKETIMEIRTCGASGFIKKPFNQDQIRHHVLKAPSFTSKKAATSYN